MSLMHLCYLSFDLFHFIFIKNNFGKVQFQTFFAEKKHDPLNKWNQWISFFKSLIIFKLFKLFISALKAQILQNLIQL